MNNALNPIIASNRNSGGGSLNQMDASFKSYRDFFFNAVSAKGKHWIDGN